MDKDLKKEAQAGWKTCNGALIKCQDEYNDLREEYDYMAEDSKQKSLKLESLEKQAAMTTTTIVPAKSSMKSKVNKKDLNQELVNHVTQTVKTVLFRTWKFIEDALEEEEVTREIIPYLPVDIAMPEEEFVANYSNAVYEAIKNARTEVQSNGKKRAKGMKILGNLVGFRVMFKNFLTVV